MEFGAAAGGLAAAALASRLLRQRRDEQENRASGHRRARHHREVPSVDLSRTARHPDPMTSQPREVWAPAVAKLRNGGT